MEKYSQFRDPGTGIQPFLTPQPPSHGSISVKVAAIGGCVLAAARTAVVCTIALLYLLVQTVLLIFAPIPPLRRYLSWAFTALLARSALAIMGIWWISVSLVSTKRSKNISHKKLWNPKAGDLIVSNWASWVEILWLAFRYDPVFVLPAANPPPVSSVPDGTVTNTRGRGVNATTTTLSREESHRQPIQGFRQVSLLTMICATGFGPQNATPPMSSLEQIRRMSSRPVVIFPECTSSNGKGLLRFAEVFSEYEVPVKGFRIFLMCARYDPPTSFRPSLCHSIPASLLNPIPHLYRISATFPPCSVSIRLLNPVESPDSRLFTVSDVTRNTTNDMLSEVSAALIAQLGKLRRVGLGWEDKFMFLTFYQKKT